MSRATAVMAALQRRLAQIAFADSARDVAEASALRGQIEEYQAALDLDEHWRRVAAREYFPQSEPTTEPEEHPERPWPGARKAFYRNDPSVRGQFRSWKER